LNSNGYTGCAVQDCFAFGGRWWEMAGNGGMEKGLSRANMPRNPTDMCGIVLQCPH
jgi:hypothetical protein